MSRVYGEPVDVWARDGKPARFVWRGRSYAVLAVVEHWVVSREWWQQQSLAAPGPPEQEFWRVEAVAQPDAPAVFELRRDAAAGDWLLARMWDLGIWRGGGPG